MNEDLKITVPNAIFYESFKWCLEYLKNWRMDQIESDHKNISDYLETLTQEEEGLQEDSIKITDQLIQLTNRMVGAEFALKAIREGEVCSSVKRLSTLIEDIEKEWP